MRYSRKKSGLKKSVTVNERIGLSWSSRLMAQTINPQQNHKSSFATTLDILFEQAKLICFNILWPKKTILSESEAKLRSICKTEFFEDFDPYHGKKVDPITNYNHSSRWVYFLIGLIDKRISTLCRNDLNVLCNVRIDERETNSKRYWMPNWSLVHNRLWLQALT